ncbi:MAG TPA: sialidase family protein [Gemmatirosa sp.]|nr:sialidase family protein [Gemmatirosa sp.]
MRSPCRPRRLAPLAALLALLPGVAAGAQGTPPLTLRVDVDRAVGAPTDFPHIEPHLSRDPRAPRRLLAALMTPLTPDNQSIDCAALASLDGGGTWTATRLGLAGPTGCGDPWTAVLADGTALLSVGGDSGIVVRRSADGGRTWAPTAVHLGGSFDHPMLLTGATGDAVYLVAASWRRDATRPTRPARPAIYVAYSGDGGRSFIERGRSVLTNVGQEAITPLLLADGTLAVGTIDHHDASGRRLERRRAWLALSRDSGATFAEPLLITESCSRTRFTAWPSLASDPPRGGRAERLFFACEAEGNHGVLFAHSDDQGDRWTAARRIDSGADSGWTKTPSMAVSADGILAVTWLDAREDSAGRCWHLYGTASLDRGATFLPPQRLSSAPSCPTAARSGAGVLARFPSGGEYHGLVAVGPREFVALWPDARDGRFRLRTVRFGVPGG